MAEWFMRSTVNTLYKGSIPFDALKNKLLKFKLIKK
jgi:hypothetical protein